MESKPEVIEELRILLRDVLAATAAGTTQARISRAHGYVDGYMKALLNTGVATRAELLQLVADERERAGGPALRALEPAA